jgi:hypothetical protein
MDVTGQLRVPAALSTGKEPAVPIQSRAGWAVQPVWTLWGREKYFCKKNMKMNYQRLSEGGDSVEVET